MSLESVVAQEIEWPAVYTWVVTRVVVSQYPDAITFMNIDYCHICLSTTCFTHSTGPNCPSGDLAWLEGAGMQLMCTAKIDHIITSGFIELATYVMFWNMFTYFST